MKKKRFLAMLLGILVASSSVQTVQAAPAKPHLYAVAAKSVLPQYSGDKALPKSVDLRKRGLVTAVKDQSVDGTCWAHATLASIETANMKDNPHIDLSERHLAYFMETDEFGAGIETQSIITGSNAANAVALLSNWIGPVSESKAPYNEEYGDNRSRKEVQAEAELHVTGLHSVPLNYYSTDFDEQQKAVKHLLDEDNSMYISLNFDVLNSLNYETSAYYYDPDNISESNNCSHAVLLAGYDDNYPAENFLYPPKNDGAWLIKNSWGLENGDCGYYWVSYEEPTIDSLFYFDTQSSQLHDNLYAHDDFGGSGALSVSPDGDEVVYFSNVYCAEEDGYVTDVMIDCMFPSDCYEITIYTNLSNNSNPASGKAHRAASGVMDHTGYQIIKLNKPVQINCGEFFSVAAKVSGEKGFHATCELANNHPESPVPSGSTAYSSYPYYGDTSPFINTKKNIMMSFGENQSFISEDGKKWTDIYNLYSEENNQIIGNVCLKALSVKKGAVHFSSYSSSLPVGSEILLSCADSSDIYYSVNGGIYSVYSNPIKFTGEMTISAYSANSPHNVYTQHYDVRTAEISSMVVEIDNALSNADVTKNDVEIIVPLNGSEKVTCRPITMGSVKVGDKTINSYDTFTLDCNEMIPKTYTITVQEDGLVSKDYNITVRREYAPYFTEGTWNSDKDSRWYRFLSDKKSGYYINRADGYRTDFTYTINNNRIELKTKDKVYEGYIKSNEYLANILWDDGEKSEWYYDELEKDETPSYTNKELCEMIEKYCKEVLNIKSEKMTVESVSGTMVVIEVVTQTSGNITFYMNARTAIGTLQDGRVVNLKIFPEDTGINTLKKGIWKCCDKNGQLIQFYYFDGDTSQGCYIDLYSGDTPKFTYNVENGQAEFFVQYEDYDYSEKKAVVFREESAIMTTSYGTVEYLTYYSDDTVNTFKFYSINELMQLASEYTAAEDCSMLPFDYSEKNNDGTVTVYERYPEGDMTHENLAYYCVDIFTAKGVDNLGNPVDLNNPVYAAANDIKGGIWKRAVFEPDDPENLDYEKIEDYDYYCSGYYWISDDSRKFIYMPSKIEEDIVEGEEYACRLTNGNGIVERDGTKRQIHYLEKDDAIYLFWDSTDDQPLRIEKLIYVNDKTLDDYKFYTVPELVTLAIMDYEEKTGHEAEMDIVYVDTECSVEISLLDKDTGESTEVYVLDQYTGTGVDYNGDFVTFAEKTIPEEPYDPTNPKLPEIIGDIDADGIITSADSLIILRMSVKLEPITRRMYDYADVDYDGYITSADALEVLRYSVKLPTQGNIGKKIQ